MKDARFRIGEECLLTLKRDQSGCPVDLEVQFAGKHPLETGRASYILSALLVLHKKELIKLLDAISKDEQNETDLTLERLKGALRETFGNGFVECVYYDGLSTDPPADKVPVPTVEKLMEIAFSGKSQSSSDEALSKLLESHKNKYTVMCSLALRELYGKYEEHCKDERTDEEEFYGPPPSV